MIVDQVQRKVRINGLGESFGFGIRDEDMPFIVSIVTDKLYSNKPLAVVREYICNAIDANKENGDLRPIKITVPNSFDPTFKVRDFGKGLSYKEVTEIYISLGLSTKRNSNEMIGAFGIGSKAAFAYTDSFNITSWYKGVCSTYTAQKDGEGKLLLIPIGEQPSDEPSGIEISVPVNNKEISVFRDTLADFLKYVKVPYDFDGDKVEVESTKIIFENDDFFFVEGDRYHYGDINVIMGNVSYPVDRQQLIHKNFRNIVLKMNLGDLDISPDREKLEYTKKTIRNLNNKISKINSTLKSVIQGGIDEKNHIWEVMELISQSNGSFNTNFNHDDFKFKGREMKGVEKSDPKCAIFSGRKSWRSDVVKYHKQLEVPSIYHIKENTIIVNTDSDSHIIPSRLANGIKEKFGFQPDRFIVTEDKNIQHKLFADTFDKNKFVTDYKSLWAKTEKNPTNAPRIAKAYRGAKRQNQFEIADLNKSNDQKPYVIVTGNELTPDSSTDGKLINFSFTMGVEFWAVPKTHQKYLNSNWVPLEEVLKKKLEEELKTSTLYKDIHINDNVADTYEKFVKKFELIECAEKLADIMGEKNLKPENYDKIISAVEEVNKIKKTFKDKLHLIYLAKLFNVKVKEKNDPEMEAKIIMAENFIKKYRMGLLHLDDRYTWTDFSRADSDKQKILTDYIEQINSLT